MSNLGLVISRLIISASNKDIKTCIELKLAVEIEIGSSYLYYYNKILQRSSNKYIVRFKE